MPASGSVNGPASKRASSSKIVLPLVVVFLTLELHAEILVMVYAAIFSLIPDLSTGWAAGKKSLRSTLLGCLAAIVVYWLFVAVPEFHFFLVLWFGIVSAAGAAERDGVLPLKIRSRRSGQRSGSLVFRCSA